MVFFLFPSTVEIESFSNIKMRRWFLLLATILKKIYYLFFTEIKFPGQECLFYPEPFDSFVEGKNCSLPILFQKVLTAFWWERLYNWVTEIRIWHLWHESTWPVMTAKETAKVRSLVAALLCAVFYTEGRDMCQGNG